ncbi:S8 family peptidase [Pseudoduganella lutea]|nr:S8 family peptidase [Pseudoduganella lutea]
MGTKHALRYRRLTLLLIAALPLLAATGPARAADVRRTYIVQLPEPPVAAYRGGIAGMRATASAPGRRLDLGSASARQYRGYLAARQAQTRAALPSSAVMHEYQVVFNGFAARLTDAEVRALKASGKAVRITPDQRQYPITNYTPAFLGLDQPGGLWDQLGGRDRAGEDIVVGVLDTGIWPENLSYADRVDGDGKPTFDGGGTLAYEAPPARWAGECQAGEGFAATHCNNKLIGARYFNAGFYASGSAMHWTEFRSPRDSLAGPAGMGGHGTHTSSTAAGNGGVPAVAAHGDLLGARSGIAPRARLAMYKVCWSFAPPTGGVGNTCYDSDSIAAIEAAVADGVDVLNYSISGGGSPLDPVEQAFRHAAAAGVFVAASAGNDGPVNAVAHISPWVATVAAAAHDRTHAAAITLGDGQAFTGAATNAAPLPAAALVRAVDAVAAGADPFLASQCFSREDAGAVQLDPGKLAGKIVVCQRGNNARTAKADAVKAAGGIGMILLDDGNGLAIDTYSVPTVHVSQADGAAIAAYAATGGATAALSASEMVPVTGPTLAEFSSRGPNMFDPGVMKPDMAAPGVDTLAGISPSLDAAGRDAVIAGGPAYSHSAFMSGTSMAAPHVAGLAALLRQRHPGWSPAAVKSALMTAARTVLPTALEGDQDGTLPWGQGAGLVVPAGAADPGMVYDIAPADFQKYLCGISGDAADCGLGTLKGHALNLPSISLPGVVGTQRVSRTVKNVGEQAAIYRASAALDGFDVTVSPATLQLAPGESATYAVELTRTDAPPGTWKMGELVWDDGTHKVRSPLQGRFNDGVEAPARLAATTPGGARKMAVQTGFDGTLSAVRGGMREYKRLPQTVAQAAPGSLETLEDVVSACAARGTGVRTVALGIPNKTVMARFEIANRDTAGGEDDDLDLVVMDQSNRVVGMSAHADSNESVTLTLPGMGVARVCVLGYRLKNGVSTNFTLSYATAIPNDTAGNVKLALPATVQQGGTSMVGIGWSGLATGKRYLGAVQLLNGESGSGSVTELDIDLRDVVPASPSAPRKRLASAK